MTSFEADLGTDEDPRLTISKELFANKQELEGVSQEGQASPNCGTFGQEKLCRRSQATNRTSMLCNSSLMASLLVLVLTMRPAICLIYVYLPPHGDLAAHSAIISRSSYSIALRLICRLRKLHLRRPRLSRSLQHLRQTNQTVLVTESCVVSHRLPSWSLCFIPSANDFKDSLINASVVFFASCVSFFPPPLVLCSCPPWLPPSNERVRDYPETIGLCAATRGTR